MLLVEAKGIKKYFGERLVLSIESLNVYSKDRIGIVGINGAGKTTLINILSKRLEPEEGDVRLYGKAGFISQLGPPDRETISCEMAAKFGINTAWNELLSGGEKTRFKLAQVLEQQTHLIFADEPTSNLDLQGIKLIEEEFSEYQGALLIISHDRELLDNLCTQIIEVENKRIKIYRGNYSAYREQKLREKKRAEFEYEEYLKEKKRLEQVIHKISEKAKSLRHTPKRMGNSEARLHKMGPQKAKVNLERAVKNVEKRIANLEVKEKPLNQERIKIDIPESNKLYSKIVVKGEQISKEFSGKKIFVRASFEIYKGSKIALLGLNGCGKSTLLKMIVEGEENIKIAPGVKIGYFSQEMDILEKDLSIIENVMKESIYPESFTRIILARFLFKGDSIFKKIKALSGGERVRVSLVKILLQGANFLILDEPTNYLDVDSLEALEGALGEYDGTLLFVSHDRKLIDRIANQIMVIENYKLKSFEGTFKEYQARKNNQLNNEKGEVQKEIFLLKNRLAEIIGKLSMPSKDDDIEALEKEYYKIIDELKVLEKGKGDRKWKWWTVF
jgi:macrolide transport system ATP-binding/permease protein